MVEDGGEGIAQRVVTGGVSKGGCQATLGSQIGQRPGQKTSGEAERAEGPE